MSHPVIASEFQPDSRIAISWRTAYHQAGHVAAVYLGNKQKQLPEVFFQIVIKLHEHQTQPLDRFAGVFSKYSVSVEGGRLIHSLPVAFSEVSQRFSRSQQEKYRCAFEADVSNLLAGSLAEAKYVTESDNEVFNAQLINREALHAYGGRSDLAVINEYMACFLPDQNEREQKLDDLFLAAFNFVNQRSNWHAITALADFIRDKPYEVIRCEEIMSLLESRLVA
jgi:hypothetical protein